MTPSPKCTRCHLLPVNFASDDDVQELRRQRRLCGWNFDDDTFARWRDEMDAKLKGLFWVTIPDGDKSSSRIIRTGHISLDSTTHPPDLELANPDKSTLTISTFFILPEYRSLGVGRAAMDILEQYARQEPYGAPHCSSIAINTLSREYSEDPEKAKEVASMMDQEGRKIEVPEKGRSNEDWYAKRGYVKWKQQPQYSVVMPDGRLYQLIAVYMRKML